MTWWQRRRLGFKLGLGTGLTVFLIFGIVFLGVSMFVQAQLQFAPLTTVREQEVQIAQNGNVTAVMLGLAGGVFLAVVLSVLIVYLLLRRTVLSPLTELVEVTQAVAEGDLERQVEVRSGDEVGQVGLALNNMTARLRELIESLEQRVAERVRDVEAVNKVSRLTAAVLELDQLLSQVVDLVLELFDLYYVGIFLLDEENPVANGRWPSAPPTHRPNVLAGEHRTASTRLAEWEGDAVHPARDGGSDDGLLGEPGDQFAVLRAGTGEAGARMLAEGWRLQVGGSSMIGQCIATEKARIALDVGLEAVRLPQEDGGPATAQDGVVRFDNPFLPETRSEMALLLRARGRTLGAMTIQSDLVARFDEGDTVVLQGLADQVAVSIDNARLFAESQAALCDMEAMQRRYISQAWAEYLKTAASSRYPDGKTTHQAYGAVEAQSGSGHASRDLVTPILLRGETIGSLGVHDDDATREWADEEIALVRAVVERFGTTADNLRLFDEMQRAAARERMVAEVTDRMRRALGLDDVLRTAVSEIRQALDLDELVLRLATVAGSPDHEGADQHSDAFQETGPDAVTRSGASDVGLP